MKRILAIICIATFCYLNAAMYDPCRAPDSDLFEEMCMNKNVRMTSGGDVSCSSGGSWTCPPVAGS